MKTKKIKKLALRRNTIANLNGRVMGNIKGGAITDDCITTDTICRTNCVTGCPQCSLPPMTYGACGANTFDEQCTGGNCTTWC